MSGKLPLHPLWSKLTKSLAKERNPTKESIEERLRKRKRRAATVRAAEVGKEAQDMRLPSEDNYKTKKVGVSIRQGVMRLIISSGR